MTKDSRINGHRTHKPLQKHIWGLGGWGGGGGGGGGEKEKLEKWSDSNRNMREIDNTV